MKEGPMGHSRFYRFILLGTIFCLSLIVASCQKGITDPPLSEGNAGGISSNGISNSSNAVAQVNANDFVSTQNHGPIRTHRAIRTDVNHGPIRTYRAIRADVNHGPIRTHRAIRTDSNAPNTIPPLPPISNLPKDLIDY